MDLSNRVVVITGATGGLGRFVTRVMAEKGARLALVSTNPDKLRALGEELDLPEERWMFYAADLHEAESAQKVLDAVLEKFGQVDILLHFVGGWVGGKPVHEVAAGDLALMIQQHLWTTFHMAQVFIPQMTSNGWGRFVIISSPNAAKPPAKSLPYSVGKAAQESLMGTLAEEVKGTGVTVNVVRVKAIDVKHRRDADDTGKFASWTTPEEITESILYLCSDEARMVNGAKIPLLGSSD